MANIASPVALVNYNPVSDSAQIVYEIPVGVNKVSLLPRTLGTSDNAKVSVNKSGLLDGINVLEKAGVVNFLAAQAGATATGLLVAGSGFVNTAAAAAGANQAAGTLLSKDLSIVTTGTGGVRLPLITACRTVRVINGTAAAVIVYPFVGDFLSGVALSATGISIAAGDSIVVYSKSDATTGGTWQVLQS